MWEFNQEDDKIRISVYSRNKDVWQINLTFFTKIAFRQYQRCSKTDVHEKGQKSRKPQNSHLKCLYS